MSVPVGIVAVIALLLVLGAPFLGIKWGFPTTACCRRRRRRIRSATSCATISPSTRRPPSPWCSRRGRSAARRHSTATRASCRGSPTSPRCRHPAALFVDGAEVGPAGSATGMADGSAFLHRRQHRAAVHRRLEAQLDAAARGRPRRPSVQFTGIAQINRDSVAGDHLRLPMVLGLIAAITFVLLFLLTGSVGSSAEGVGAQRSCR